MDPNSKYNITPKLNSSRSFAKVKPTTIYFGNKNGGPSPNKKIKLIENGANGTPKKLPFNNTNGNTLKSKIDLQEQRKKLPLYQKMNELVNLIKQHSTLIILAETGSGKTTQIPQYINAARIMGNGKIAVTQPRRVAAISVAMRVAQEYGNEMSIGDFIGYSVRFEDCTSKNTRIKFLTDGILLREALANRLLLEYTVIILDEAHERTIHTDILFGIVKEAQRIRAERHLSPLKIIIMSAKMDVDHLSNYFNNCPVVFVEGRTFPVTMFYAVKPQDNYQTACISTFFKIHQEAPPEHDVLIFLTGQEEIESCASQIRMLAKDPSVKGPPVKVCTLYAAQPSTQQIGVFQPAPRGSRKVVISTNIAETSVTISGIKYVIDGGMVKARTFHPSTGMEILKVQRISQEQAWQRSGRAGRESEGYCYRVYTKSQFELMNKNSIPEILCANLNSVAIQLLALGLHMLHFDFLDKPSTISIQAAYEQLNLIGAMEDINSTTLTRLGKKMSKFPLDPRFSKILLSADTYECLDEALTVVSLLSSESILLNPVMKRQEAQNARVKFNSSYGDQLTLLNIYKEFENISPDNRRAWCLEHFINMRNILYVREVRAQLQEICRNCDMHRSSCGGQMDQLRKCLLSGLFMNVAELYKDRQYITLDKRQITLIHPSSYLHGQQPHCLIFTEVVQTTKCYLRGLTTIDIEWLKDIAPEYIKKRNIKFRKES